jgi:hypothetical protein
LPAEVIVDDGLLVRLGFVRLAIGAAEIAEIVQHDADGDLGRGGREWAALTHTQTPSAW